MERVKVFQSEIRALFNWHEQEQQKIDAELKARGEYQLGLDTNQAAYSNLCKEFNRRFAEIVSKYKDLPPDTKIFE